MIREEYGNRYADQEISNKRDFMIIWLYLCVRCGVFASYDASLEYCNECGCGLEVVTHSPPS
jgi:hypothetical protein